MLDPTPWLVVGYGSWGSLSIRKRESNLHLCAEQICIPGWWESAGIYEGAMLIECFGFFLKIECHTRFTLVESREGQGQSGDSARGVCLDPASDQIDGVCGGHGVISMHMGS